jgi:hypothetical protein
MEATPAARVAWYEERVVLAKAFEEFMRIQVLRDGNQPPHALHLARFRRLQAETELLKLKEEVGKGEKKGDGRKQESMRDGRGVDVPGFVLEGRDQPTRKIPPTYTAFPKLRPPKRGEDWNDTEVPELPRPKSADGDSALRQFHVVQVREGAEYLRRIRQAIPVLSSPPTFYLEYAAAEGEIYRAAAELEDTVEGKVRWHEALIVGLKRVELYIEFRVRNGDTEPHHLHLARFLRLKAEDDRLELERLVGATGGEPVPGVPLINPCPGMSVSVPSPCRPRLLFRRHR